jgi:hypothetical protein
MHTRFVSRARSGDEVVEPSTRQLGPGQIRDANRSMMLAAVAKAGAQVRHAHTPACHTQTHRHVRAWHAAWQGAHGGRDLSAGLAAWSGLPPATESGCTCSPPTCMTMSHSCSPSHSPNRPPSHLCDAQAVDLGVARDTEGHLEGCLAAAIEQRVDVLITSGADGSDSRPVWIVSLEHCAASIHDLYVTPAYCRMSGVPMRHVRQFTLGLKSLVAGGVSMGDRDLIKPLLERQVSPTGPCALSGRITSVSSHDLRCHAVPHG